MTQDTNTASGAADLPEALRSIQRFEVVDCIDEKHVPAVIPKPHGPWVRYADHVTALAGQTVAEPADTVVLNAAMWAIKQAIELIGAPTDERIRAVRRVLRGAVIVAEDACKVTPLPGVVYAELPVPNYPKSGGFPGTFAEAQMRAFADATCAMRASHGQVPAGEPTMPQPAPQQEAHHLAQALTDLENQPNQYGVEFGMSGTYMHFKIGNQLFKLAYEPDEQEEFDFMKRMLVNALTTFTHDVKTAQGDALSDAVRVPLNSLHADAAYLIGRLRDGSMPYARVIEIIRERIDAAFLTAQAAGNVPAPPPPPECETEAEKRAFAFGWFKAQEADRAARDPADSVQEDAARLTSEQEHAIRQGHEIAASDRYFGARQQIDSNDRRNVFQAGFERGWDAARKQGGAT